MTVLVMIPTRNRPHLFLRAVKSVFATSRHAYVAAYVDTNDPYADYYRGLRMPDRTIMIHGEQIGVAAAANSLVNEHSRFDAYGLLTDDSVITTPGWDKWLLDRLEAFEDGCGVVSPSHNLGFHVDMPFVSRRWIEVMGWFAEPNMNHFCWPTVIGLTASLAGRLHRASASEFAIQHDQMARYDWPETSEDATALYRWLIHDLDMAVEAVKEDITHPNFMVAAQ